MEKLPSMRPGEPYDPDPTTWIEVAGLVLFVFGTLVVTGALCLWLYYRG